VRNGHQPPNSTEDTWLRVEGTQVVDGTGKPLQLRGFGLGGWMNMENFITGYGSSEAVHRSAMSRVLGADLAERFFDSLLNAFFGEEDARLMASLGANSLRIPVNYRHFESDQEPGVIKPDGFRHLDRAIAACAAHGIYSIIDLHATPGGQNGHWHSDTMFHEPQLWEQRSFRDRTVLVWEVIADRYRDNPWVAGYNFLNEPASEDPRDLVRIYERLEAAVRAIDPRHTLFLDGNRYSTEWPSFGDVFPNTVYAVHHYPPPCPFDGGPYPGVTNGEYYDKRSVEAEYLERTAYIRDRGAPIWVGEFGPVYTDEPEPDRMKRQLLTDQLEIYERYSAGWSLWTYKDMGMMGLVRAREESPWLSRTAEVRAKKARLGVDPGGSNDRGIADVINPVISRMAEEFPWFDPYPFGLKSHVVRLVRGILFAEPLAVEFAECFRGITDADIDEITASFRLDQCVVNDDVRRIVAEACKDGDRR
jgi:endoglucanase